MLDLLIKNVGIVDGTGAPAFTGDIAVHEGAIAEIAPAIDARATRVRGGDGLTAVPGFIDIHRHADIVPFLEQPEFEELSQGITTFVAGVCGFSAAPASPEHFAELKEYAEPILGPLPEKLRGMGFGDYLEAVRRQPLPANMGCLVGNGALRIAVSGFRRSPLSSAEVDRLKGLLREALQAGAFGLSIGLMYVPEMFYSGRELVEIFREVAAFGRPVFAHIRGEGSLLLDSIREVLDAAAEADAPVHISHLKAAGKKNWNSLARKALDMIADARAKGRDVSHDVYPYAAGSSAMHTLLPPEFLEGGVEALLKRLADPAIRREIEADLRRERPEWDNLVLSTGWQSVTLAGGGDPSLIGKTVAEIAADRHVSPEECMMLLILENRGNLPMVFHSMSEDDMVSILTAPGAIGISDSLYAKGGLPHPRKFGSQARLISHYALNKGVLSLEEAVRSVTMLPARRLGLRDRGVLAKGMAADIVLLDLERYRDTATFTAPRSLPEGIRTVILGGTIAMDCGRCENGAAGKLLTA